MFPTIRNNDYIYIDTSYRDFNIGDILFFKDLMSGEFISHRVLFLNPLVTKGDRNLFIDEKQISIHGVVVGCLRDHTKYLWGTSGQAFKLIFAFFSYYSCGEGFKVIRLFSQMIIFSLGFLSKQSLFKP